MPRRDPAARFSRRISVDHAPSAPASVLSLRLPRSAGRETGLIGLRPGVWQDAARLADALGPAARRDLVRVLTSPSEVRADVIRQLHERPDGQEMADLLIFLEEWEWARLGMIEDLSRA